MWGFIAIFIFLGGLFRQPLIELPKAQAITLFGILLFLALFLYWARKQIKLLVALVIFIFGLRWYVMSKIIKPSATQGKTVSGQVSRTGTVRQTQPQRGAREPENLLQAVTQQDEESVARFLAQGADPNNKYGNEYSALTYAIWKRMPDTVQALVKAGASVNEVDGKTGATPLEYAVGQESSLIVNILLEAGADVNYHRPNQNPHFMYMAVERRQPEIVYALAAAGSKEVKDFWFWHETLRRGEAEIIRGLLDAGYEIPQDYAGFRKAVFLGDMVKITMLLSSLKEMEKIRRHQADELAYAVAGGKLEILRLLYETKIWNRQQEEALYVAIRANQPQAVKFLLDNGAQIDKPEGMLSIQWAFSDACERGYAEVVKLLLAAGMMPDAKAYTPGHFALHEAAKEGQTEIVKILLVAKANTEVMDIENSTPIHYAVLSGNLETVKALAEGGADLNKVNIRPETPLRLAVKSGKTEIADYLRAQGAKE